MGGGGTYYKNVKEKMFTVDKEFMGKEFLVVDSLPKLSWKLESESKIIGDYTCFKATAVKPVDASDMRNYREKKKKEGEEKETIHQFYGRLRNAERNYHHGLVYP